MNRLITFLLLLPAIPLASGCAKKINPESMGLMCDEATDICTASLALSPSATTYTNKTVTISVNVTPSDHPPDQVQLIRNGQNWKVLTPPSLQLNWDTTKEAEGSYEISASATIAGSTVTSNTITVDVDRTPPTMTFQPINGASNVALSDPILVTFSEPVDPASISGTTVKLTNAAGTDLGATSTLSADMTSLAVTIGNRAALSFPATISGVLGATVTDRAGNAVGTSPAWTWTAPPWVKLPSFLANFESMAFDSTDRAYLLYGTNGGPNANLTVARYAVGSTWDLSLGSPTSDVPSAGYIAIGPNDAPVVAWSGSDIRAAQWTGSAWSALGDAIENLVPAVDSFYVSSVVVGPGGPLVAWTGNIGTSDYGYVASWSGSAWQALPPGASAAEGGPTLRASASGTLIGYFPGSIGSPRSIDSFQSGSWTTLLSSNALLNGLTFDTQGRPVVVTQVVESSLEVLHVQVLTPTGWTDLTPSLPTGSATTVGLGQVVIDSAGNPVVLWAPNGSNSHLSVARFNGTAWDTTFGMLTGVAGGAGTTFSGDLAVDALGAPTVAWIEENTTTGTFSVYTWKSNR